MRGSFVFRILATVLLIGILVAAGVMIFQAGQAQGYALAAANAGKELAPQTPGPAAPYMMPYYYGYPRFGFWPHFFFFPFGLFFFGLLFFFLVGGLFRRRWWRHGGGNPYGPWSQGPQGPQNPPSGGTGQGPQQS